MSENKRIFLGVRRWRNSSPEQNVYVYRGMYRKWGVQESEGVWVFPCGIDLRDEDGECDCIYCRGLEKRYIQLRAKELCLECMSRDVVEDEMFCELHLTAKRKGSWTAWRS